MSRKKWPPLEARDVLTILRSLGLTLSHSKGGHDFYKGTRGGKACTVTFDAKQAPFEAFLLKSMADQARASRDEFYGALERPSASQTRNLDPSIPVCCPTCGTRLAFSSASGGTNFYQCGTHGLVTLPPDGMIRIG